jgi:hypothetical protein
MLAASAIAIAATAVVTWPWLRAAVWAIPDPAASGNAAGGADARLMIWTLAWVVHALSSRPLELFSANVFHPQPDALARSDHLLSSAVLSAPVALASGNPVLAANLVAVAGYALAALTTYWVMRRVGLPVAAAALAAVLFALTPTHVPANLHALIQLPTYVLPLVLLASLHVADGGRWLVLAAAVLWALFSSYYLAAMAVVVLATEVVLALAQGRRRTALAIAAATGVGLAALLLFSLPYLAISRELPAAPEEVPAAGDAHRLLLSATTSSTSSPTSWRASSARSR